MAEKGCLQNEHINNLEVSNQVILRNPISVEGPKRTFSVLNKSLVDIDGTSTQYSDGDVLLELGKLNLSGITEGEGGTYPLPQKILITDVTIMVHTAASTTLNCRLDIGSTGGIQTNEAAGTTELIGISGITAGWSMGDASGYASSKADIPLHTGGYLGRYGLNHLLTDTLSSYLYIVTSTTLNAKLTAGSFSLFIDYYVL